MATEQVTKFILGFLGTSTGVLSLLVLKKLREGSEKAMAKMKLSSGKTLNDFRILGINNFGMFLGFIMYAYSRFVGNETLWLASKVVGIIYATVFVVVLFRWWRRL
jgi:hypothetical protein